MRRALLIFTVCTMACGGGSPSAPSPPPVPYAAERQFCLDKTNEYRATVGRPPLVHSAQLEQYADAAAQHDGTTRVAHEYFRTRGGASAENELLAWSLPLFQGNLQNLISAGLAGFWSEGPNGGHRINMTVRTQLGCGIFVNGNQVTFVQAFH